MVFLEVSSVYVGQYSGGPALNVFDGIARVVKDLKQGFGYVSKNNVMISVIVITILMNFILLIPIFQKITNSFLISYLFNKIFVLRVSSAAIKETLPRVSIAR